MAECSKPEDFEKKRIFLRGLAVPLSAAQIAGEPKRPIPRAVAPVRKIISRLFIGIQNYAPTGAKARMIRARFTAQVFFSPADESSWKGRNLVVISFLGRAEGLQV